MNRETLVEVGIIGGMVGVQVLYAVNSEILSHLLSVGLDQFLIVIFITFASFLLITPFAFLFERRLWPRSPSFKLKTKLVLVGLAGLTLFQWLYLEGMKLTSASMATAMPNLSLLLSFLSLLGLQDFIMSLMHSTTTSTSRLVKGLKAMAIVVLDKDKILGCIYLLLAVCCMASSVVLQASILVEFLAPISMFSIIFLISGTTTIALQYVLNGSMETGSASVIGLGHLVGFAMLVGLVSGGGLSFNAWVIKRQGPVLVSLFSPISTVVCVVFSAFSVGESFNLGSFAGMALMFGGLYFVLWAKAKEYSVEDDEESVFRTEFDLHKPLVL